jgi:hypothetical protein
VTGFVIALAFGARANAQPTGWEDGEEAAPVEPVAPPAPDQPPPPAPLPPFYAPPPPWFPMPPPGVVPVIIEGDRPGLRFSIATEKKQPPFAYCPDACTLGLYPGKYWLTVHQSRGIVEGKRAFEVEGPARARVTPRTEEEQSSGRTMGYFGVGLLAGGLASIVWGIGEATRRGSDDSAGTAILLGLGAMVTGAVLTPIGFVRGGRSAPKIEVDRLEREPRR